MRKPTVEKFSLQTIKDALNTSDLQAARASLSFAVGASLEGSGTILKFVKRDELCRLVIETGADSNLTIFANFSRAQKKKLRKNSAVLVRGKLKSFGLSAVCLDDCKLKDGEKS
jgi:hypothetical protein